MNRLTYTNHCYHTPPDASSFWGRLFPSFSFYTSFLANIYFSSRKAQRGEYDDEAYGNIKYTTTYTSLYYPGESGYMSYAYGLLAATVAMLISGFAIYWYRRRREKPFKEVNFNEKN